MPNLPSREVRRIISYLREQISDEKLLAEIEDELNSDQSADFLREPDILNYFPQLEFGLIIGYQEWQVRIIPHANLRMIQRGIDLSDIKLLFQRFVEFCQNTNEIIVVGAYKITGKPQPGAPVFVLRVDIDEIKDEGGKSHVVTIYFGQSSSENIEFELD